MSEFAELTAEQWGYEPCPAMRPLDIASRLEAEVREGIRDLRVVSVLNEPADENPGFERVCAEIAVSPPLYHLLLNGRSGYRAQYFAGEEIGEAFNRLLVETVIPLLISNPQLHTEKVTGELCRRSLSGEHTKFWFPKEVTSLEYEERLRVLPEVILADRWRSYWSTRRPPRKGLLAPIPDEPRVLLNGTFLHTVEWRPWNQKPNRSRAIWETGWT